MKTDQFARTSREAKAIFKKRTGGREFSKENPCVLGIWIFRMTRPTATRKFFIGTDFEFLNA